MNDTEFLTFLSKGVLKWNFVEDITDVEEQVIYGFNDLSRLHIF